MYTIISIRVDLQSCHCFLTANLVSYVFLAVAEDWTMYAILYAMVSVDSFFAIR